MFNSYIFPLMVATSRAVMCRSHIVFATFVFALVATPADAQTRSRTERFAYEDNAAKWVMGQVKTVTCVSSTEAGCSNTLVAEATYDATTASQLTYKSFGKLLQTLTYNTDGTVATVKDGNNKITGLSNWYRGVPQTITYPDTTTETAVVNGFGWISSSTDETQSKTCFEYDDMGRLKKTIYPSETSANVCDTTKWSSTSVTFAQVNSGEYGIGAGHWRSTSITGSHRLVTYYDGLWRPLVVREYDSANASALQRFQRFRYDHESRKTFESHYGLTDSVATGKRTFYDPLGRVSKVEEDSELGILSTTREYLPSFQTRVVDPRGFTTTTGFQAFDQPSEEAPLSIAHPEGAYSNFTRDAHGKALSITRRNSNSSVSASRTYAYNANGELCRMTEPETGATLTGYDGAGNVKWTAAGLPAAQACESAGTTTAVAARRVARTYDTRNRLLTLAFPDGRGNQTWTYTLDGRPNTVSVANQYMTSDTVTTYGYHRRGLRKSESVAIEGVTYLSSWEYNGRAHLSNQTYPSGLVVWYEPNALGQPTKAGPYATSVTYHPNGAVQGFTYGNGVLHTMAQNARQLPSRSTDCKVAGCTTPADMRLDLSYTYDESGNVTSITDGEYGRQTRGMTYDGLDRLKTVSSTMFGAASYTYDVLDNLTQTTIGAGSSARNWFHCYDTAWRLVTLRTGSCTGTAVRTSTYDVQGNLATWHAQTFRFDFGNRLHEVVGVAWHGYDGLGHRVYTSQGPVHARFVYSNEGQLLYTNDVRNNKQVDHIYLSGSLVALREQPAAGGTVTTKYQHTDALGSPVATTGADQSFIAKYEYEPYGILVNGTLQDGPGFAGHVQDAANGLVYMQQRYYDTTGGRFLSVDPVLTDNKTGNSFNRYAYANNNPYKFVDPDGRNPFLIMLAFGLAINDLANGDAPIPAGGAVKTAATAAERLAANAARGKIGESLSRSKPGSEIAGEKVTIVTSDGKTRTVIDFVTNTKAGGKGVVETKTGNAKLTKGQTALKADIDAGKAVTPVGENAKKAGLEPGVPVKFQEFVEDRW